LGSGGRWWRWRLWWEERHGRSWNSTQTPTSSLPLHKIRTRTHHHVLERGLLQLPRQKEREREREKEGKGWGRGC
jgi:hypothetical protein